MLAAGDFDMMPPFFRLYSDNLGMAEYRARLSFGHDGAMFPETMTFFGTYAGDDYGWDRTGLKPGESPNLNLRLHFSGNLETVAMMLDYVAYTGDAEFVARELIPMAHGILTFFAMHYPLDEHGQLRIEPSQALETWQDTINPVPEIAGLRFCCEGLLRLPADLVPAGLLELVNRLLPQIPPLPIGREKKGQSRVLSLFAPLAHNALHRVCGTPAFNSLAIHAIVIVVLRLSSRARSTLSACPFLSLRNSSNPTLCFFKNSLTIPLAFSSIVSSSASLEWIAAFPFPP